MRRPPYLPFLNGPPVFAVGLAPIPGERWLAPDVEAHRLTHKHAELRARGDDAFRQTPGSAAAQEEVLALIAAVEPPAAAAPADFAPLQHAALLVSDDLCIMQKRGEVWGLTAAVLCAPSQWSLAENIGGPLTHLHGPVPDTLGPDGAQGLAHRIARVFDALREDVILERFNWTVQAGPEPFAADGAPMRARAMAAPESEALDLLHLRVERQTIRLLPRTGAVLFTIRVSLDPLRGVFAVDGAKAAFADAWKGAAAHVRAYKKWPAYERLVAAALA